MRWGDYKTTYEMLSKDKRAQMSQMEFYSRFVKLSSSLGADALRSMFGSVSAGLVPIREWCWLRAKRPYFNLWPGIDRAILAVNGEIPFSDIPALPVRDILVRLDVSQKKVFGFDSIFISDSGPGEKRSVLFVTRECRDGFDGGVVNLPLASDGKYSFDNFDTESVVNAPAHRLLGLFVGLCLIGNDPRFVESEVLACDRAAAAAARSAGDSDLLAKLVARAANRGVVGWSVGRTVESCPHLRRPHLAIRWTGKGGAVPKLVPVKAAVVNRQKFTEVPTGYLDSEVTTA